MAKTKKDKPTIQKNKINEGKKNQLAKVKKSNKSNPKPVKKIANEKIPLNHPLKLALQAKLKQKVAPRVSSKEKPVAKALSDGQADALKISKKELKAKKKEMLKDFKDETKSTVTAPVPAAASEIVVDVEESEPDKKALKRKNKKAKREKAENENTQVDEDQKTPTDLDSTLFIGNLGQNIKKQHLNGLFKSYGEVKSVRIRTALGNTLFKHKTRRETESLIAFVSLDSRESADKALELSGTEFRGRHIRVTRANKEEITSDENSKRTVFVGNLKYSATEENLFDIFSSCGEIESVRTMKNAKGCKGVAFVCFKKPDAVGLAIELNETMLNERPIHVERYSKGRIARKKLEDGAAGEVAAKRPKREHKKKNLKKAEKGEREGEKKSSYRGVKVGKKKFKKSKTPNLNPIQRRLAAKIAPKL